jgi:hypothetical protein
MPRISKILREQITRRANGLCEYCQTSQDIVIEMEIDHIVPVSAGGTDTAENLCLTCVSCNHFKRDFLAGNDPLTEEEARLFNPRTQSWHEHFEWQQGGISIAGLTPTGRATVERLRMNREVIIKARRRWIKARWHPPETD